MTGSVPGLVDHLFRHSYGRIVAGLTRVLGPSRLDLVEDVVQEALLRALRTWPYRGVPEHPEAWLAQVARHLAVDAARRRCVEQRVERDLEAWAPTGSGGAEHPRGPGELGDDTLGMMFLCCHPTLTPASQVALVLKTVCGFGVREIAASFVAQENAVAQRITRAKERLRQEQVRFEVLGVAEREARLDAVLDAIYLLFNGGYCAHEGAELVRLDLVHEAVRLGELLLESPELAQPKVFALNALTRLLGARLPARVGSLGELLTLELQDRSRWDRGWLQRGFEHFARSIGGDALTPFHAEAAIAACHASAAAYEDTDWTAILARYDHLLALRDTPITRLNRAVAVAKVHGPRAALGELDALTRDPTMPRYHLLWAVRAQLRWLVGDREGAVDDLRRSIDRCANDVERAFLTDRLQRCRAGRDAPTI